MLKKYPKVQQLGLRYTTNIYKEATEITEKLDGSQFRFGLVNDNLMCCSKGAIIDINKPDKLFSPAVKWCKVLDLGGYLEDNLTYFGETLCKPKHNTLTYDKVPKNNIALFAIHDSTNDTWLPYEEVAEHACALDVDVVDLLFRGDLRSVKNMVEFCEDLLYMDSQLGGTKIEGFVIKNLHREVMVGDRPVPFIQGKFVSEQFKERHKVNWKNKGLGSGWELFKERYRTDARWDKATQHLREQSKLINSPSIGYALTNGDKKSCGCLLKEKSRARMKQIGKLTPGTIESAGNNSNKLFFR